MKLVGLGHDLLGWVEFGSTRLTLKWVWVEIGFRSGYHLQPVYKAGLSGLGLGRVQPANPFILKYDISKFLVICHISNF